ncbi:MAG TPA: hypothetical protein VKN63_04475 [Afifellaceae bacterium]|nr:hypothetical protein [Afifellaceae bacterium]
MFRRLVQPIGPALPLDWSHCLVSARTTGDRPQVAALREWILEEIAEQ